MNGLLRVDESERHVRSFAKKASLGEIVLMRGVVAVDREFGSGYSYGIVIEGAAVRGGP